MILTFTFFSSLSRLHYCSNSYLPRYTTHKAASILPRAVFPSEYRDHRASRVKLFAEIGECTHVVFCDRIDH